MLETSQWKAKQAVDRPPRLTRSCWRSSKASFIIRPQKWCWHAERVPPRITDPHPRSRSVTTIVHLCTSYKHINVCSHWPWKLCLPGPQLWFHKSMDVRGFNKIVKCWIWHYFIHAFQKLTRSWNYITFGKFILTAKPQNDSKREKAGWSWKQSWSFNHSDVWSRGC